MFSAPRRVSSQALSPCVCAHKHLRTRLASDVDLPKPPSLTAKNHGPGLGKQSSARPRASDGSGAPATPRSGGPSFRRSRRHAGQRPGRLGLRRLGPDAAIPRDDDETTRHGRYPVGVECSERTLRDQLVPGVDRVLPRRLQGLAEPKRALVDVEPKVMAVGRHAACARRRKRPSGSRAQQLVANGRVDVLSRQLVQVGDHVG